MRIGGEIKRPYNSPEEWLLRIKEAGYSTVLAPVGYDAKDDEKQAYKKNSRG